MKRSTARDMLSAMLGTEGFGELRGKGPTAGCEFTDLSDPEAADKMVKEGVERSQRGEYWVGLNPRIRERGKTEDVEVAHVLFIDCDTPESLAAVEGFPLKPSWCVKSGSVTDGFEHRQFGWLLRSKISRERFHRLEDRLIPHLKGDMGWSRSGAGVVRLPGTLNHKTTPPRPVLLDYFHPERRYAPEQFEELLPEAPKEVEAADSKVEAREEIVVVNRRDELPPLQGLERHLREGRGKGRNDRVYHVFLRQEFEAGKSKADMLAQERRVTEVVNEIAPSDHAYDGGEYRASVESRIRSGLRSKEVEGLAEILDAAMATRMSESTRRVFNVYVEQVMKASSPSFSISDRDTAIASSASRPTVESSRQKLHELGFIKRTRKSREGKASTYRLQPPTCTKQLPQQHALDGQALSQQEIRLQSQFSSSFAFCGLSLRTFSALVCLDRFATDQELADLLGVHPKTIRRRLARFATFGLVARVGQTFKALLSNLASKLRKAAKVLGTAWACERRKRLYEAESRQFYLSRKRLSLHRRIDNLKAKIPTVKRGLRPFLRCQISDLTEEAIDVLIAPRPPTPATC